MVFITQPTEEGEKMNCPNCDAPLIARLKVYENFDNKIQWQDSDKTKAHFDKVGGCKGEPKTTDNEIELKDESQTTIDKETAYIPPITLESLRDEIKFQREILQSILHIITDLKLKESKTQ